MATKRTNKRKPSPKIQQKQPVEIIVESFYDYQSAINEQQHEVNKKILQNLKRNNNDILILSIVLVVVISVVLISD